MVPFTNKGTKVSTLKNHTFYPNLNISNIIYVSKDDKLQLYSSFQQKFETVVLFPLAFCLQ